MLSCFTETSSEARTVHLIRADGYAAWRDGLPAIAKRWLDEMGFTPEPGASALLPGQGGELASALLIASAPAKLWDAALLVAKLPEGSWTIDGADVGLDLSDAALGWALASYRYDRYKKTEKPQPKLVVPSSAAIAGADELARSIYLGRDLVNTPTNDLGPDALAESVRVLAGDFGAAFECIVGDDLLTSNYPAIHAVGRASANAPRLIDMRWGDKQAPKLTLVGKGVCFDTGGLDLKPASAMRHMKKDMGGSAAMIALARAVMALKLPVCLRLLVPAVENSVSASAFRPGDILSTRKGLTVEVGNTDAEGRLVLADCLTEAISEDPELLIDAATLTGAARVALGSELPVLFANRDATADALLEAGEACVDPMWRLPLHPGYRKQLNSRIADIGNIGSKPQAGAITAALFLQEFVGKEADWLHLDVFGWNDDNRPGRPRGGEATAVRAMLEMLSQRFPG